jgi:DNA adenine methylase
MPYYTPLRYPGGKRRLVPVVTRLLEENNLRDIEYVEPYAGGAAVALTLLFEEYAATVHMNDLSRAVFAFWQTVLHDTAALCERIKRVKVTMAEWRRQRKVYENRDAADLADLGFATLFLNRTNRSGIIGGGVIGGKGQTGAWSLDARFTKDELINRIRRIGRYRNRIRLYSLDALQFTKEVTPTLGSKAFVFFDPPYIENGKDLYLNDYDLEGHQALATRIQKLKVPWIVTYDAAAARLGLYSGRQRMTFSLSYTANARYKGREVMFFSDRLRLPSEWQESGSQVLMSRPDGRFPIWGEMQSV